MKHISYSRLYRVEVFGTYDDGPCPVAVPLTVEGVVAGTKRAAMRRALAAAAARYPHALNLTAEACLADDLEGM